MCTSNCSVPGFSPQFRSVPFRSVNTYVSSHEVPGKNGASTDICYTVGLLPAVLSIAKVTISMPSSSSMPSKSPRHNCRLQNRTSQGDHYVGMYMGAEGL